MYPPPPTYVGGYPQPYGYQPYSGYPAPGDTNGFAIASLVSALVGIFALIVGPLLGIVFGVVALHQLGRTPARGRGLAIAGIIIGSVVLLLDVLGLIGLAVGHPSSSGGGLSTYYPTAAIRSLE